MQRALLAVIAALAAVDDGRRARKNIRRDADLM